MERKLANVILNRYGVEDRFDLRILGIKFHFGIKPISGRNIIRISYEISCMSEITDETQMVFHALIEHSGNIKNICNSIAIATNSPFKTFVSYLISRLSLENIETLWNIVLKQSNPSFFLSTMVSAKSMNLMKKS